MMKKAEIGNAVTFLTLEQVIRACSQHAVPGMQV